MYFSDLTPEQESNSKKTAFIFALLGPLVIKSFDLVVWITPGLIIR